MAKQKKAYQNTMVPWTRTQGHIHGLLMEHGAKAIQWTDIPDRQQIDLKFGMPVEVHGVHKEMGFWITVPIVTPTETDSGRSKKLTVKAREQARNQTYRALYWWMKAQLEAVQFGIQPVEKVFFSYIVARLPDGRQATIGDAIRAGITKFRDFQLDEPIAELLPPEDGGLAE